MQRPLDYRIDSHADLVLEYLFAKKLFHFSKADLPYYVRVRGAFQCIEHRELIEKHGFDSLYTSENGWLNIHVYDRTLVSVVEVLDSDPGDLGLTGEWGCRKGWEPTHP